MDPKFVTATIEAIAVSLASEPYESQEYLEYREIAGTPDYFTVNYDEEMAELEKLGATPAQAAHALLQLDGGMYYPAAWTPQERAAKALAFAKSSRA